VCSIHCICANGFDHERTCQLLCFPFIIILLAGDQHEQEQKEQARGEPEHFDLHL